MVETYSERLSQWLAELREALSAADPLIAVGAALLLFVIVVVWVSLKRGQQSALAAAELAEIKGRLTAMSEMAVRRETEQARVLDVRVEEISGRLSERVDALSRRMSESLDTVSHRLGDNLAEAGRRTTESLSNLNERLAVIAEARQSLANLSSEVTSLTGVLADKQARGAFGQLRMETIIRDALPAGAYEFQPTLSNGKRPDCVIRLPNTPAVLVIDSKFPLEGFEALRISITPDAVKSARDAIRAAVGKHVDDIAGKYLIPGETQDTALMFVPSESVYGDLHEHFPDLVQRAHRARVVIVAPNVLMLAVQTVQAVIKDAKMRDQAGLIQREVGLLLGDVARLVERVGELERHFGLSAKALEKVTASAGRISGRGERLTALDLEDESGASSAPAAELTARAS